MPAGYTGREGQRAVGNMYQTQTKVRTRDQGPRIIPVSTGNIGLITLFRERGELKCWGWRKADKCEGMRKRKQQMSTPLLGSLVVKERELPGRF